MSAPWNPPATLPAGRRVVLLFKFPVPHGDGGNLVDVAHVGSYDRVRERFAFSGPAPKQVHSYPLSWLNGWTEVPS